MLRTLCPPLRAQVGRDFCRLTCFNPIPRLACHLRSGAGWASYNQQSRQQSSQAATQWKIKEVMWKLDEHNEIAWV
jgi:hypothetical protein